MIEFFFFLIFLGAGLIMKAIIEESSPETSAKMQMLALAEGAVPVHLLSALFTQSSENRLLMQRQLSRHLIGNILPPFKGHLISSFRKEILQYLLSKY